MDWQNEISVPHLHGTTKPPIRGARRATLEKGGRAERRSFVGCGPVLYHHNSSWLRKGCVFESCALCFFLDSEGVVTVTSRIVVENRCLIACNLPVGTCMVM